MSAAERIDRVPDIRRSLTDVRHVCAELGLLKGAKRQSGGLICLCPHGEKHPSLSVTLGRDSTIRIKCFSCGIAGDVFHLIAAVDGLDVSRDFPEVLERAARIAGVDLADRADHSVPLPEPTKVTDRVYPLPSEVASLWQTSKSVTQSAEVAAYLESRGLDPERVARADIARALREGATLPRWASYRGEAESPVPWFTTGHRLILPVHDHVGKFISVRAARVIDGNSPKRLPPAGHRQSGLVLANKTALALLGHGAPADLLIVEGEPDFLTWALAAQADARSVAVIGIGSGSWTREFANRIPRGTRVVIRTHQDKAGDKYAAEVARTLARRCAPLRPLAGGDGDENDRLRAGTLAPAYDAGAVPMSVEAVDPASFVYGRMFLGYGWLGDELRPGVFAARCPAEVLHERGERFDGSTLVRAPDERHADGSFRCSHGACRGLYETLDVVGNAMRRIAESEGL